MHITSTRRLHEVKAQPQVALDALNRGEQITIEADALDPSSAEAVATSLAADPSAFAERTFEFRIPNFADPAKEALFQAEMYRAIAQIHDKRAELLTPKAKPDGFSITKTAGYTVVTAGAGYGAAVAIQTLTDAGRNSGNPWLATSSIAIALAAAALGADAANDKIVFGLAERAITVAKSVVT